MTDLRGRMRIYDQAPAPDYWSEAELRASAIPQPERSARPTLILVGALLAILLISAAIAVGSGVIELPSLDESPSPSAVASIAPTSSPEPSAATPAPLGLPGAGVSPAGEYGWTGAPGSQGWMHSVVSEGDGFRQTQIIFAMADGCFTSGDGPEPLEVTVAGVEGLYVEPYRDLSLMFYLYNGGETIGGYALPIDGRILCVYLAWDTTTTQAELESLREIVETVRGHAFGPNGLRITFTLPAGWDTG
jgi:hypothetical protein